MFAYRIDRHGNMSVGKEFGFYKNFVPDDAYSKELINNFISGYVSDQGRKYLNDKMYILDNPLNIDNLIYLNRYINSLLIEYTFELVRQARYPHCFSRYQSIFAVKDLKDFSVWPELHTEPYPIYKIEYNEKDALYLDANFLSFCLYIEPVPEKDGIFQYGFSPGNSWHCANQYWSGATSDAPKMELLISSPVKVIEQCR